MSYFNPVLLDEVNVNVTINEDCKLECPVTVFFGTRPMNGGSCIVQHNITKDLSPGATVTFSVETASVSRKPDEEYCFYISGCEVSGINEQSALTPTLSTGESSSGGSGIISGILAATVATILFGAALSRFVVVVKSWIPARWEPL